MTVWAIVVAIATDRSLWARSWASAEPASPSANSAATGYANLFIRTPPELKPPFGRAAWQSYYLSFSDLYRAKRGPPPPQVSAPCDGSARCPNGVTGGVRLRRRAASYSAAAPF